MERKDTESENTIVPKEEVKVNKINKKKNNKKNNQTLKRHKKQ